MLKFTITVDAPDLSDIEKKKAFAHQFAGSRVMREYKSGQFLGRFRGQTDRELRFEMRDRWYDDLKSVRGKSGKSHNWSGGTFTKARQAPVKTTRRSMMIQLRGLHRGYGRRKSLTIPDIRSEVQRVSARDLKTILERYGAIYPEVLLSDLPRQVRRFGGS